MIKKIIFDLDNTLIDWKEEYDYPLRDTLIKYNIDFNYSLLSKSIDEYDEISKIYNSYDLMNFLNNKHNLGITIDFINDWLKELGKQGKPNKGVVELLEYLHNKYELVVLTNWESNCQKKRLKSAGIYDYFNAVFGGEVIKKPSEESFMKAIYPNDIEECVMVGDSLHFDIEPAIKLGMKTYMIGKDIKTILDLKEML